MRFHRVLPLLLAAAAAYAHPMGNFSVSHYINLELSAKRVQATYVLDLAEIPTFELLRDWKLDRFSAPDALNQRAAQQAREWMERLAFSVNGQKVRPVFESASIAIADGAGNLPIARITTRLRLDCSAGRLEYEDRNYPDRAGWKEIVIRADKNAHLETASQDSQDRSNALTSYPQDPTVAPPQDLRADVQWIGMETAPKLITRTPVVRPIEQPVGPAATSPATLTAQAAPAGSVVRGDFLSRLLHNRELSLGMILIALLVAFGLGAAHALTPGHGKTIVAAYLVGSRGTLKHAAFLGAAVTFTHTVSVFALGLVTLFLSRYLMPEKITQILGAISGLSIVALGGWMIYKRIRGLGHHHHHGHPHHDHHHPHAHDHHHHSHDQGHHHHDHGHDHHHGHNHDHAHGHSHHHDVPEPSWAGLLALGVSGGLVPCESALILLLGAIALGRTGLGLLLLIAFSLGLATVLIGIGALVIFAKHLIPERKAQRLSGLRWVPVFSGAVVVCAGLLITAVSLGWLGAKWTV